MAIRRVVLALAAAAGVIAAVPGSTAGAQTDRPLVREIEITGTVDPLIARTAERGIGAADDQDAALVLIRIDTPGGLDSAMRTIIEAVLGSRVPVACWVGPQGARAASAGAIILLGCPVATMAPGTNAGAAHPVGFTGEVLAEKVTNDAAAYARSLAERWNRPVDFAEDAVRESVSVTALEALDRRIIEAVADDRAALLDHLSGRTVRTASGVVSLPDLGGARIEPVRMTLIESILHSLVDPNLAFLFFLFGIAGIVFEVTNPGISVPGILGVLLLVSSLVMLGMLPVNLGGLILLLAAVAFFVVDVATPGTGIATAAGVISLVAGGLFLFDASVPNARVSRPLIVGTALGMGLFFGIVIEAAVRSRKAPQAMQTSPALGAEGVVVRDCDPSGVVYAAGEEWSAKSDGEPLAKGTHVRVVAVDGLTLRVVPLERSEVGGET